MIRLYVENSLRRVLGGSVLTGVGCGGRWASRSVFLSLKLTLVVVLTMASGCGLGEMEDDGFGKIRSDTGFGTVDGISGFVHLIKQRGGDVRTSTRISPRIERYDTIVWAPDRKLPPRKEAVDRLQRWVEEGDGTRVLVFIGPGFRGRQWLEKKQIEIAGQVDLEKSIRRYSEKLIRHRLRKNSYWRQFDGERCQWYEMTSIVDSPIQTLGGVWSEGLDLGDVEIYSGTYDFQIPETIAPLIKPMAENPSPGELSSTDASWSDQRRTEVLLSGDGHNLIYRIASGGTIGDAENDSGIYILANGSFVQNFGLMNPSNQMIAKRLADLCGSAVLVLESGPEPIAITDKMSPEKNGWAWLGRRPLREIVPFFLLVAMVAFFAAFPIHGRPKRIRHRPEKTFADHVRATGRLLKSTKGKQWAQSAIEKYQTRTSDKNSG